MRAAATEIAGQSLLHLVACGFWRLRQKRCGGHDHPARTVPALRGLLGDERRLHSIGFLRGAEAFDGGDGASGGEAHRRRARPHGAAVHEHGAGAALTEAAPEFHTVQRELVAQHVKQRLRGIP